MRGSRKNITRVLDQADRIDINEGRLAYFRYHEVFRNLSAFYGVGFAETVAVFCATSPNNDYLGNLRSAASIIKGFVEGVPVERIRVTTYNHCRDRAFQYLNGTPFLRATTGKKIRSFYLNILNPMDPEPVTIDGHAVNIWRRRRVNLVDAVGGWNYERVANDYRRVASDVGLLPNQLQSITWFTWKRIHNIKYPGPQFGLFQDPADFWRTLVRPESIVPFDFYTEPVYSTLPARRDPGDVIKQNGRNQKETRPSILDDRNQ